MITAIFTAVSAIIAGIAALYAMYKYETHLKEEKTRLLCDYNQRYASCKDVKRIIEWIHKVVVEDEKGKIMEIDIQRTNIRPTLHTKEIFMRFFEEINIQLSNNNLDLDNVFHLFAYYPLLLNKFPELREDIADYKSDEELSIMDNEEEKKRLEKYWSNFRTFIKRMKIEHKRIYGTEYE